MAQRALTCRLFSLRTLDFTKFARMYSSKGKGGDGGAGSIRESGGAFGKKEAAVENEFFRRQQAEQLGKLKNMLQEEIKRHEDEIKHHQDAINQLKQLNEKGTK